MSINQIFENIYGGQTTFSFNRNFLKEKIRYYKETSQIRPELMQDIFIYNNYDAFEIWCNNNNKKSLFPDLEFKVKDWN
tara:strand:- start:737 stop:973 length:237 start_codon:yes stop_codon:yes gene_type:complete